ncbi:hypothetical protein M407DRAFT_10561 [Tulasnella calospora MUT 4182]|uniref:Uncharacterized protein n=1 Tax=Tulasnella calospora MUT 4182 TaxID=1051891 RepID=A0A0C3PZT4_9AGAM|nr:hypothetical protein M407DRAFT_10561 [Tulasnella calospora MUT 4182]
MTEVYFPIWSLGNPTRGACQLHVLKGDEAWRWTGMGGWLEWLDLKRCGLGRQLLFVCHPGIPGNVGSQDGRGDMMVIKSKANIIFTPPSGLHHPPPPSTAMTSTAQLHYRHDQFSPEVRIHPSQLQFIVRMPGDTNLHSPMPLTISITIPTLQDNAATRAMPSKDDTVTDDLDERCVYLAQDIQDWLVLNDVTKPSATRNWGRELFWMAFVAVHPCFPGGEWPDWDSRVPMEGDFIDEWMTGRFHSGLQDELEAEGNFTRKQYFIWSIFQTTVTSRYPRTSFVADMSSNSDQSNSMNQSPPHSPVFLGQNPHIEVPVELNQTTETFSNGEWELLHNMWLTARCHSVVMETRFQDDENFVSFIFCTTNTELMAHLLDPLSHPEDVTLPNASSPSADLWLLIGTYNSADLLAKEEELVDEDYRSYKEYGTGVAYVAISSLGENIVRKTLVDAYNSTATMDRFKLLGEAFELSLSDRLPAVHLMKQLRVLSSSWRCCPVAYTTLGTTKLCDSDFLMRSWFTCNDQATR